jgi:hypothetical protein
MNKFLFLLFGLFMISSVYALGVTPGRTTIDFEPNLEKTINFDIINSEGKDLDFTLSVDGELSEYVSFENNKISMSSDEGKKTFSYSLKLPSTLEPGLRTGRVIITEVPEDTGSLESHVSATLAVATQIYVNVPFPGKYASSKLIIYNVQPGEDVTFVFPVSSIGKLDLDVVYATVDVYNKENEKIGTFNTDSVSIPTGERKELVYKWNYNLSIGEYRADAILNYDGGASSLEGSFIVGSKELELKEINVNDFELGQIVKFEMLVENKWSEPITDAYIETEIQDSEENIVASFKSTSYNLNPLTDEVFVSYWDTDGVEVGSYASEVSIYYGDKVTKKSLQFDVSDDELVVIGLGYVISVDSGKDEGSLVTVLVTVIVVLVLLNLLWFLILRKKIGGKK